MPTHTDILGQPIHVGDRIMSLYENDFWVPSTVYGLTRCYVKHDAVGIKTRSLPSKCIVISYIETLRDIDISSTELMDAITKTYPEKLV